MVLMMLSLGVAATGCEVGDSKISSKAISGLDQGGAGTTNVGALALSFKVVEDMKLELVASGVSTTQAEIVANGALAGIGERSTSSDGNVGLQLAGAEPAALSLADLMPYIVAGGMKTLNTEVAGFEDVATKANISGLIMKGVLKSVKDKGGSFTTEQRQALPGVLTESAVASLTAAGFAEDQIHSGVGRIMQEVVANLDDAGYDKSEIKGSVTAITKSGVNGLRKMNVTQTSLPKAMENLVGGAAGALGDTGFGEAEFGELMGPMMQEAVGSLSDLGFKNANQMQAVVGGMMGHTVKSLKKSGAKDRKHIGTTVGRCMTEAFSGIGHAGIASDQLVFFVDDMMKETVSAFGELGVQGAGDIQALTADISEVTMQGFEVVGIKDAYLLKSTSKALATGAMSGLGVLRDAGAIDNDGVKAASKTVSQRAVAVMVDQANRLGFKDQVGWIAVDFATGMVAGLAAAGWRTDDIKNISDNISEGFNDGFKDAGSFDDSTIATMSAQLQSSASNFVADMERNCVNAGGRWHPEGWCEMPEIAPKEGLPVVDPKPEEAEACRSTGGAIRYDAQNHWFCLQEVTGGDGTISIVGHGFTPVMVTTERHLTLEVYNPGAYEIRKIWLSGLRGPFSLLAEATTCGAVLAPKDYCRIVVRFAPMDVRQFHETWTINFADGFGPDAYVKDFVIDVVPFTTLTVGSGITTTADSGSVASGAVVEPVTPVFPTLGADWLDYVLVDLNQNLYSQAVTACNTSTSGAQRLRCRNGGELRKIRMTGFATCDGGWQAQDALDAFSWHCTMIAGAPFMVTSGLKKGKRLADLITASSGGSWLPNAVEVRNSAGGLLVRSEPALWYHNPVVPLPDNSGSSGTVQTLSADHTVYFLDTMRLSHGYRIVADHVAVTTLSGAVLRAHTGISQNCTVDGDMAGAAAAVCLLGVTTQDYVWLEGLYDGNFVADSVVAINNAPGSIARSLATQNAKTNGAGLRVHNSPATAIRHFRSGNDHHGLYASLSNGIVIHDVVATNSGFSGVYIANSHDAIITKVLAFNAAGGGAAIYVTGSDRVTLGFMTVANSSFAVKHASGDAATIHNGLFVNNNSGFYGGTVASIPAFISDLVIGHSATYGFQLATGFKGKFSGRIYLGFSSNNDCYVQPSAGAGFSGVAGGTCSNEGVSDATIVSFLTSLASSFVGKVTDSKNPYGSLGTETYSNILDFLNFENPERGWGRDGGAFPATDHGGNCNSSNSDCSVWDFSLADGDGMILDRAYDGSINEPFVAAAPCPSGVDGNVIYTNQQTTPLTYLRHAIEVVGDQSGNENGLCESNEVCIYAPNYGAYQGHGNPLSQPFCHFTNGTVANVMMFAHPTNGR